MASAPYRQFLSNVRAKSFIHRGVKSLTAAVTLSRKNHAGRTCVLNLAAGFTVTLPAATGSGDRYRLLVGTALTSGQYRFDTASGEIYEGGVFIGDSGDTTAATADFYTAGATSNRLDMTLTSGGGAIGDWIELEDFKTDKWLVTGNFQQVTDPATPFAAV